MKKYKIIIIVDTNDADYSVSTSEITEEDLDKIRPLIEAIKNFKPYSADRDFEGKWKFEHNFPIGECCRTDLGEKEVEELYDFPEEVHEIFNELIPHPEWGFHTITEITLIEKEKKLL